MVSSLAYFFAGSATVLICIVAFLLLLKLTREHERVVDQESTLPLIPSPVVDLDKRGILFKVWINLFSVFVVFMTTLFIWPSMISLVKVKNNPIPTSLDASHWWPLILLMLFSLFDVIGRFLASSIHLQWDHRDQIWKPVLLRTLTIPLLISELVFHWFSNDYIIIVIVIYLGFSNGYTGTKAIVAVMDHYPDSTPKLYNFLGSVTSLTLNCGLVVGSVCALIFDRINP